MEPFYLRFSNKNHFIYSLFTLLMKYNEKDFYN